jgi:CheY-like chemotaxis protein
MKNDKPKILIIDDETGFTKLTKLAMTDFEVCEENSSSRALETARKFQPDLIHLDGGDIAAQIKADPALTHVPIVFLTAIVTEKETQKRQLFGGYPFISKPITPEKLAESIRKHLVT